MRLTVSILVGTLAVLIVLLVPALADTSPTAAGLTSVNGVPLCAHDPTVWHPLVLRNADGSVQCTYGHEHGENPADFDASFGHAVSVPGGQQISYPWFTVSSSGIAENSVDIKHRVYKWMGFSQQACANGNDQEVTALRLEAHNDGNLGATARFHSYWFEANVTDCATSQQGYVSMGGHNDFAVLKEGIPPSYPVVPESSDPPAGCSIQNDGRTEGSTRGQEQSSSVWYSTTSRPPGCDDVYGSQNVTVKMNLGTNSWGPIDPSNPGALLFYPDRQNHDGTTVGSDTFVIMVSGGFPQSGGLVSFQGFVDRHGNVVASCAPLGADCIPLTLRNVRPYPAAYYARQGFGYDGDVPGPNGVRGYYVQDPSLPAPPPPTPTPAPTATPTPGGHHRHHGG